MNMYRHKCYQFSLNQGGYKTLADVHGESKPPKWAAQKICYKTQNEAQQASKHYMKKYPEDKRQRPYFCFSCNMWHLTKKLTSEEKRIKNSRKNARRKARRQIEATYKEVMSAFAAVEYLGG